MWSPVTLSSPPPSYKISALSSKAMIVISSSGANCSSTSRILAFAESKSVPSPFSTPML